MMANGQAMIWIVVSKVFHDHSHNFQEIISRSNQEEKLWEIKVCSYEYN